MSDTVQTQDQDGSAARAGWRRRVTRPVVVAAAALLVGGAGLLAAGAAIAAGEDGPSAAATEDESPLRDRLRERWGGIGGHGPMGAYAPMAGIRGEFVVPDGDGGYQTLLTQTGETTAVGTGSITVRSEDGYSHTYTVTDDTTVNGGRDGIGDVSEGDLVHVTAVTEGGADTAVRIGDLTTLRESFERWGGGHMGRGPFGEDRDEGTAGTGSSSSA